MAKTLTDHQKRCSTAILARMQEYIDLRYAATCRANPKLESVWPDVAWSHMMQLKNTIENDKSWGPVRYVIAEVLSSDDKQKIRDIFTPTHQSSIQNEVVEKQDTSKNKTADVLAIHDFTTLYAAIDPSIATIAGVIQIYMWWDLKDASDLSRFDFTLERIQGILRAFNEEAMVPHYSTRIKKEDKSAPTKDDILNYELKELRDAVFQFNERRNAEPGYKIIIARRSREGSDNIDRLISAIAREQILLKNIESGTPLDDGLKKQFASALNVDPDTLNSSMEVDYLKRMLADHKKKLRAALTGEMGGEPFNFKRAQADAIQRKFDDLVAQLGAQLAPAQPEPVAAS